MQYGKFTVIVTGKHLTIVERTPVEGLPLCIGQKECKTLVSKDLASEQEANLEANKFIDGKVEESITTIGVHRGHRL